MVASIVAALAPRASSADDAAPPAAAPTTPAATAPPEAATAQPRHGFFHAPEPGGDHGDYVTRRYEPAGFPLIGGDSDIGFQFGVVGTLSHFANGVRPYEWNMDLLLSASVKQGPSGLEIAQQSYLWQFDLPSLYGGELRLNPEVAYNHTINYGYFGLGNASSGAPPPAGDANPGRFTQWIDSFVQVRSGARVHMHGPLWAEFAAQYLYVAPGIYSGSALARDATTRNGDGSPFIRGTDPLSLPSIAFGLDYDTRDDEIFPHSGVLHEIGVRLEEGLPFGDDVRYAEFGAILRAFVPLVGPVVLAGRLVLNAQVGNVPFFDLFQAGPFDQKEMPGGSAGIRGVPVGRYLGPIKAIGNIELRAMLVEFSVLHQNFTLGNDVFFDTGRVWSDYSFRSPLDGSGIGLKYGVGGGIYFLWGEAAMLRIEAAYSPDAVSENPTLPIGIYVNDNTMF
ncbi:MAG TPA: BamA/TamA family outer membrane protein [Polyangiaceae bacterium]|nr:BamA/TamA family outer membrane protein [Polyangiaceae bacterium]